MFSFPILPLKRFLGISSSGLNRSLRISLQSEEMFSLDLRSERERERDTRREGGRRREKRGRGTGDCL